MESTTIASDPAEATTAVVATTSPSTKAKDRPYFGRVEALRGLGALAVAGVHFSGWGPNGIGLLPDAAWDNVGPLQNGLRWLGRLFLPGHAAVMGFFVISGFVLRLSLEHGPQQLSAAAAKFLLGRTFRMYPIVIFAVVLSAILIRCHVEGSPSTISPSRIVANMLLLDVSMNRVLWALQVELLMVPVILGLYFVERRCGPGLLLGVAGVVTALAYKPHWALWPAFSTNVFPFVLGMVVPTLGRRWAMGLSLRFATWLALGTGAALLLTRPAFGLYSRNSAVIEAYAAFVLISLVAYRHDIAVLRWLDGRLLRVLGPSSGSYYVLHMATVPLALALTSALIPGTWSARFPVLVGCVVLPIWLLAIVPFTLCTFYLIETPGIRLGRRVMGLCRLA